MFLPVYPFIGSPLYMKEFLKVVADRLEVEI
jgi:hypothetical protein